MELKNVFGKNIDIEYNHQAVRADIEKFQKSKSELSYRDYVNEASINYIRRYESLRKNIRDIKMDYSADLANKYVFTFNIPDHQVTLILTKNEVDMELYEGKFVPTYSLKILESNAKNEKYTVMYDLFIPYIITYLKLYRIYVIYVSDDDIIWAKEECQVGPTCATYALYNFFYNVSNSPEEFDIKNSEIPRKAKNKLLKQFIAWLFFEIWEGLLLIEHFLNRNHTVRIRSYYLRDYGHKNEFHLFSSKENSTKFLFDYYEQDPNILTYFDVRDFEEHNIVNCDECEALLAVNIYENKCFCLDPAKYKQCLGDSYVTNYLHEHYCYKSDDPGFEDAYINFFSKASPVFKYMLTEQRDLGIQPKQSELINKIETIRDRSRFEGRTRGDMRAGMRERSKVFDMLVLKTHFDIIIQFYRGNGIPIVRIKVQIESISYRMFVKNYVKTPLPREFEKRIQTITYTEMLTPNETVIYIKDWDAERGEITQQGKVTVTFDEMNIIEARQIREHLEEEHDI